MPLYNVISQCKATMRHPLLFTLSLIGSGLVFSQTHGPASVASNAAGSNSSHPIEKRTERIRVEDADTRIDELRVGGETQAITVQPKSSMPAYQVAPKTGERSWKILGF